MPISFMNDNLFRVVPRGKIAEKVSRFDVDSSGPRCVIETKPLGSVSSRAKFFERAMEEDRKAADAAYVPVNQRIAKEIEKDTCSNQGIHTFAIFNGQVV